MTRLWMNSTRWSTRKHISIPSMCSSQEYKKSERIHSEKKKQIPTKRGDLPCTIYGIIICCHSFSSAYHLFRFLYIDIFAFVQ